MNDFVYLIHWNQDEARESAQLIEAAGYRVDASPFSSDSLRHLRSNPPAAVVIDLSRLPSHGREVAMALRQYKGTRAIPIIFVDGQPDKVERVKELLPDATYAAWQGIGPAVQETIDSPPFDPVRPRSVFDAYAGTPLFKKLGIKDGSRVSLVDAPQRFEAKLGDLPEGVLLQRNGNTPSNLTLWFVTSSEYLQNHIHSMRRSIGKDGLWVIWPKKTSDIQTDLNQVSVRRIGMDAGLVDYKIASIDETWSGLRFTLKKRREPPQKRLQAASLSP